MAHTGIRVGPADHGRRMSLDDFDRAEGREGYRYELSRGMVTVSEIPGCAHFSQIDALRRQLSAHRESHPKAAQFVAGAGEAKIMVADFESERHPDLSVYQTRPAPEDEDDAWWVWIPELIIEVVAPDSRRCDYEEKPAEYLAFGVREYWIVDAERQEMLAHRRWRGEWSVRRVRPPERYRTPSILPGFELDLAAVFEAVKR